MGNKSNMRLIIIFIMISVSLIFLTSCIRQYVCYNGDVKNRADECPKVPAPYIDQKTATSAVDNYGIAYARAKNDVFTRVNVYSKNTTWYADVLFTNTRNDTVSRVTLIVDGKTASITCASGCEYIDNSTITS